MQLNVILKALWIGSTMTIPGISGGTMAVIVGIYEELISSINGLLKNPKKHLPFLLQFVTFACIGFVLFARLVTTLLENPSYGYIVKIIFVLIILAGLPFLYKKTGVTTLTPLHIFFILSGTFLVIAISSIPPDTFTEKGGLLNLFLQLLGGIIIAIALVLPGISVSHMLYILGIYESVMHSVYSFHWFNLVPLLLGIIAGTFATTSILEKLLKKYPDKVYMTIIGFVAASLITLI